MRVVPAYLRELRSDGVRERGDLDALAGLVAGGGVVVLSGAGISTESGIPDYRGPEGALRRHSPMTFQEFTGSEQGRRRYWARSFVGWPRIALTRPNAGHLAVAELEAAGLVDATITQNVDGLHQAGGARTVVDLHGRLDQVVCLSCRTLTERVQLERRLREANPTFAEEVERATRAAGTAGQVNPDGDVALPEELVDRFVVVDCVHCGADALKPDVVFFGESVPRERVARCAQLVEQSRVLLVLGSSLTVMSGFRLVLQAGRLQVPVAIVNAGPTRGDDRAEIRLDAPLGQLLTELVDRLR